MGGCVAVWLVVLAAIVQVPSCTAQFQSCHDAANCGGNVVTGVTTARDCCLGDGLSFQISGICLQCIVHGFERTVVSVDEGAMQETLRVSLDIKGNTLDEPANFRVNTIELTLMCQDATTESNDYSTTACGTLIELDRDDAAQLTSEVLITFPADNTALEGTEVLSLRLENTQSEVISAGNIFFQDTSIQIRDTTTVRPGFLEEGYDGREGPDRRSLLPNIPCRVVIRLKDTTIETPLTLRLTPRTFPENVAANGPQPPPCTAAFKEANASRMDFNNTQPFEVTMAAGTQAVAADIPVVDDEINEAAEDFVVVLEVVNTTNPVEFTTQTTVCRIPQSDPIEIGFTQARIEHNETQRTFMTLLEKDRPSEQTFVVQIQISTPSIRGVGEPATPERRSPQDPPNPLADFRLGSVDVIYTALTPQDSSVVLAYTIFEDQILENTEIFQLSSDPDPDTPNNPDFDCDDDPMYRFNGRDCFPDLQVLILDDDIVVLGFVETLVEVNESDGKATLNVSISHPAPDPLLPFLVMFRLDATMMSSTAGARPASAGRFDPIIPGSHDYQEIAPGSVLRRDFEDTRHSQTFNVVIYEDDVPEGVEELNVTLSLQDPRLSNRVIVRPAVATVRIRDNDRLVVGFERSTYLVREKRRWTELCVIVSVPMEGFIGDVTFNLTVETRDGSATGVDYIKIVTTLGPFTSQQPRQCFRVNVIDDGIVEPYETFTVALTLIPASVTTITANRITVDPPVATVWIY